MPLDCGLALYSAMTRNANPFHTYHEMDLRCFWEYNVETLRYSKIMIYFCRKNRDMNIKGVITGDIVDSTSIPLEKRTGLLECMSSVLDDIKQCYSLCYEYFRGDSVQIVVDNPSDSLVVSILFRIGLRVKTEKELSMWSDARLSIGIGMIEFLGVNVNVSDGEAFRLSGRALDQMGKSKLCLSTPWEEVSEEFGASLPFVDDIVSGLTTGQASALYYSLLKNFTKKEIASVMGQTSQNVSRLLILAKEKPIRNLISRFRTVITSKTA